MVKQALVVTGGVVHDFDRPRLALLDLLYQRGDVSAQAAPDYSAIKQIETADALLTYTCAVFPTEEESAAIRAFLERGGRWLALHGTNVARPDTELPALCGSRFVGHPPYGPFSVQVSAPDDPLLAGIGAFDVEDELYVVEEQPGLEVLLETTWGGATEQNADVELPEARRSLMYRYGVGAGEVVYFALGHCQRPFDLQPRVEEAPAWDGPWGQPEFETILRRCVDWACEG
jgi:uncharacterized protein